MHATLTARDFFLANFLPLQSLHLHFFPEPLPISSCVSCGWMQVPVLSAHGIEIISKICVIVFWVCIPKLWMEPELWFELKGLVV